MVIVERLLLSSFTYVNILTFNPYVVNFIHLQGHVIPRCVYQRRQWLRDQDPLIVIKKWAMKTRMSKFFYIHKLKLIVKISPNSRTSNMKLFLFMFLTNISKMFFINWCFDGILTWGFYFKSDLWRMVALQ